MKEFSKENEIFIELHYGGFEHGVNWCSVGFYIKKHPLCNDHDDMLTTLRQLLLQGWEHDNEGDEKFWTDRLMEKIMSTVAPTKTRLTFHPDEIPLVICPSGITDVRIYPNVLIAGRIVYKTKVRTNVVMVCSPYRYKNIAQRIMEYLVNHHPIKLGEYVPMDMKGKDPTKFHTLLEDHERWMNSRSNIQMNHIPNRNSFDEMKSTNGSTLRDLIMEELPHVLCASYDAAKQQVNILVDSGKYKETLTAAHEILKRENFIFFHPIVKQPAPLIININYSTISEWPFGTDSPEPPIDETHVPINNNDDENPVPINNNDDDSTVAINNNNDDRNNIPQEDDHHHPSEPLVMTVSVVHKAAADALEKMHKEHQLAMEDLRGEVETLRNLKQESHALRGLALLKEELASLQSACLLLNGKIDALTNAIVETSGH